MSNQKEYIFAPTFSDPTLDKHFSSFCKRIIRKLKAKTREDVDSYLLEVKHEELRSEHAVRTEAELELLLAQSLLLDMLLQDWTLKLSKGKATLSYLGLDMTDPQGEKERIRRRHWFKKNEQLESASVKEFIRGMEKQKQGPNGWCSIFSLMRDGKLLATELNETAQLLDHRDKLQRLSKSIKPYLQFVETGARCTHTGLKLMDIWRYFRHGWANDYQSIPGRSINILIRDGAVENHPVIGIACLGSATAQQTVRDDMIGWNPEKFVNDLIADPTDKKAKWILDSFDRIAKDNRIEDFLKEGLLAEAELEAPTLEVVRRLKAKAKDFMEEHRRFPGRAKVKDPNKADWKAIQATGLYRSKRAIYLADMLSIKLKFEERGFVKGTRASLEAALEFHDFRSTIKMLIRRIKADRVGIDIMDIMVCGAVAPYNSILGGKLVCMLLCSPEVVNYVNKRYKDQVSVIASGMKGEKTIRKPNLAFLSTTSLYGVGSSQYNRVKLPLAHLYPELDGKIEYKRLGVSEGYGLFHISEDTKKLGFTLLSRREKSFSKVNMIFGEGANPKMRKMRSAFEALNLDSDGILKHSNFRVVYGIALMSNFQAFLIGFDKKPLYLIPLKHNKQASARITCYWMERWLIGRIERADVLAKVAKQVLSHPIEHGARVQLSDEPEELNLFTSVGESV